jgi:alpha-N-arabinofuranosidase
MPETNQFGTDEFLKFCELIGAQPQIALNLGSGTAQEAAEWVRYVNEHWPHAGLTWELGNELWGDWNLGYPTLEELAARTRQFSEAVRAADPKARVIATGQDPDVYQKWNAAQLTNPAGTFDYLSTHFVVTTDRMENRDATEDEMASASFAMPVGLGRKLRDMKAQIDETPNFHGKKADIAFTEWLWVCCGRDPAHAPRWDNMGGAVTTGGFFNMLIQNADIVPISDMTGIIEFAGIWKKRGRVFGTPAYYAFQMYSSAQPEEAVEVNTNSPQYDVHHGVTRLPEIPNVPYLDLVAVTDKDAKHLTLFCVNRHLTQDIKATIAITGFTPDSKAAVEELSAPSIYEENDETRPEHIVPVKSSVDVRGSKFEYTFRHEGVTRIDLTKR